MAYVYSPSYTLSTNSPTYTLTSEVYPLVPSIFTPNPFITPFGLYATPAYTIPLPSYLDVNQNPETHRMLAKHFYYRTLDDWLWEDENMKDILNYIKVSDKGVDVLNSMSEYKSTNISKDTQLTYEQKIEFIEKKVLSVDNMEKILKKFVKETNIKWVELVKNHFFIKDLVKKYLKQKLEYMIESKLAKK
jgi:hypothetical protein